MTEGFVKAGKRYPGIPIGDYEHVMHVFQQMVRRCRPKTENVRQPLGAALLTQKGSPVVRRTAGDIL
jgi:hypothetical protein